MKSSWSIAPFRRYVIVSCPLWGWSGNPPVLLLKWSSIRNGVKFLSWRVPIERRTRAPSPSGVSIASKNFAIPRGLGVEVIREGSFGGITGRPTKVEAGSLAEVDIVGVLAVVVLLVLVVIVVVEDKAAEMYGTMLDRCVYKIAVMQIKMESSSFMDSMTDFYMRSEGRGTFL